MTDPPRRAWGDTRQPPPAGGDAADEAAVLADRHLAELMAQSSRRRPSPRREAAPARDGPVPESTARGGPHEQQGPLVAPDRVAEVLEGLSSAIDGIAAEVALLTASVVQAFEATNDRLASLERLLLADHPAAGGAAEQAVTRLRLRLRQTGEALEKRQGASEAGRRGPS